MLCAELVEVDWRDKAGRRQRMVANLEDISLAGACVQVDRDVPRGTEVAVRYGDGELHGVVRYCLYRDAAYFLGLEFQASSRWSPTMFRPQHMLDPRELTMRAVRRRGRQTRAGAGPQPLPA